MSGVSARAEWEHELANKPNTPAEFRKMLDARGKDGWEFAGAVEFGASQQLVFKRPKGGVRAGGFGGGGVMMGSMMPGGGPPPGMGPPGAPGGANSFGPGPGGVPMGPGFPGAPGATGPMTPGGGGSASGSPPAAGLGLNVVTLKNAQAAELARVLEKVFPKSSTITPDPRSNTLIIRANEETLLDIIKLVERLDRLSDNQPPAGASPAGGSSGPGRP